MSNDMMTELAALMRDLGEIDSEVKAIEFSRDEKRERIAQIVQELGGKVEVMGVGTAMVTPDSETHSYDTKALDILINIMVEDGELHTVKRILSCKKTTKRKGSLRVTMAK
jgi:nicotinic acid phosphoribosyltransferase